MAMHRIDWGMSAWKSLAIFGWAKVSALMKRKQPVVQRLRSVVVLVGASLCGVGTVMAQQYCAGWPDGQILGGVRVTFSGPNCTRDAPEVQNTIAIGTFPPEESCTFNFSPPVHDASFTIYALNGVRSFGDSSEKFVATVNGNHLALTPADIVASPIAEDPYRSQQAVRIDSAGDLLPPDPDFGSGASARVRVPVPLVSSIEGKVVALGKVRGMGVGMQVCFTAPPSSLRLTKVASAVSFTVGKPASYTLTLESDAAGAMTAVGTVIQDIFPDSLSIGVLPAGCTRAGQTVTCNVPAGTRSTSFVIPVTPSAAAVPSVTNTATAFGGGDPACTASGACSSTVTTPVTPPLTITSTKTASTNPLVAAISGQFYTVEVTVANEPTTAPLLIADTLPVGLTLAGAPSLVAGSTTGMLTGCPSAGATTTGCRVEPGVAPGTFSIRIPVNVPTSAIGPGRGTNTANLSGGGDAACTTALNQRCDATTPVTNVVANAPRVRIYKNVRSSVTGTHVFEFALTGLSASREAITVVNGALGIGLDSITGTAGVPVTITERALAGWPSRPVSASCTDATSAAFGTLKDSTLTIPGTRMVAGANILCTFINDAAFVVNGRVFNDSGVGSGVPNDGLTNGAEAGIGSVAMRLTDCVTTSLGSAATDGRGRYSLDVPFAMAPGARLCVEERTPAGFLSTGASVGTVQLPAGSPVSSGGKSYTYTRTDPADRIAFTWDNTARSELNFGDVAFNTFSPDGARSGPPGSTATYAHTFVAQTGGAVSFEIAGPVATPAISGWSGKVFADAGCTGTLQGGAQVLYPPSVPVTVAAGQRVCVVMQEFIPANAQNGNSSNSPVRANFTFTNAAPSLSASYTVHDITTVSSSALELKKEVRNVTQSGAFGLSNQAKSGETLEYRIAYTNNGITPIGDLTVSDTTPAYTAFVGAAAGATPAALTACAKTTPANPRPAPLVRCEQAQPAGGSGWLNWKFSGSLPPGATGEVLFQVKVE